MATAYRREKIQMRHLRLRKKVSGTPERPRLAVHFSGKNIYAQIIESQKPKANAATAIVVGKLVAERAKAANVTKVVFDRGGFIYHGKVKALADAAREAGLQF
jgi:large subunit ribosomal protein L18